MALAVLGGMPIRVGGASRQGVPLIAALSNTSTVDATNEASIMIGQIFTSDGGSHTINTTGSSSLGWRTGVVTFANAGTTLVVGLAAVDTTSGPPARAVNVANVITFDVSSVLVGGGGGVTATAWQEHVPTAGTKTIAHGDVVAFGVQMIARGGADAVVVQCEAQAIASTNRPEVTSFTSIYTSPGGLPNAVITFSDGAYGFFVGGFVASLVSTIAFNNTSSPLEYGNIFQFPVPVKVYGIVGQILAGADFDLVLYTDPLGTPASAASGSIDSNVLATIAATATTNVLFTSPVAVSANTPVAGIIKPTTGTNVTATYLTRNAAAHQDSDELGQSCYAVNRASGAFASQNSNKDRFGIGLLIGAFDDGLQPVGRLISAQRGTPY